MSGDKSTNGPVHIETTHVEGEDFLISAIKAVTVVGIPFIRSEHEEATVVMPDGTQGTGSGFTKADAISSAIQNANSKK